MIFYIHQLTNNSGDKKHKISVSRITKKSLIYKKDSAKLMKSEKYKINKVFFT